MSGFNDNDGGGEDELAGSICKGFQAGRCRHGSHCRFLHVGEGAVRDKGGANVACAGSGDGGSKGVSFPSEDYSTWVGPLVDGACQYYCDIEKQYPFHCGEKGYALLQELVKTNQELLDLNQKFLDESGKDLEEMKRVGFDLYTLKPSLKGQKATGVTWTNDEYSHPGFEFWYLRLKSLQRFCEMWATLERSAAAGVFDGVLADVPEDQSRTITIVSIGGGPGYELLAARHFFKQPQYGGRIETNLISMDLCEAWGPYNEQLGIRFQQWCAYLPVAPPPPLLLPQTLLQFFPLSSPCGCARWPCFPGPSPRPNRAYRIPVLTACATSTLSPGIIAIMFLLAGGCVSTQKISAP